MGAIKSVLTALFLFLCIGLADAGTYTLIDGQTVSGDPMSFNEAGVVLGSATAKRTPWNKFSQEALKQLMAEAKSPRDAAFIAPFIEETIEELQQQQKPRQEIVIKEPPRVDFPTGKKGLFAAFGSSIGLTIFLVLYAANIYAAYETARFRWHPVGLVCGVSAVLPVIGPIIFLCVPPRRPAVVTEEAPVEVVAEDAAAEAAQAEAAQQEMQQAEHASQAAAPALPPTVTFRRGEFTFNRRFFETKLPGLLRVVPSEEDKDMVLYVKCARGEFVGKRISRITQTELELLTFHGEATAPELIPFAEIYEMQLRHKDMV